MGIYKENLRSSSESKASEILNEGSELGELLFSYDDHGDAVVLTRLSIEGKEVSTKYDTDHSDDVEWKKQVRTKRKALLKDGQKVMLEVGEAVDTLIESIAVKYAAELDELMVGL